MSALHAKVICVDQQKTLITSANLSYHGQEGNIELGTIIDSGKTARGFKRMNNHLPISREMEAVMKKRLSVKFSEAEADGYWKKILTQ